MKTSFSERQPRRIPKQVVNDLADEMLRTVHQHPPNSVVTAASFVQLRAIGEICKRMGWTQLLYKINHALLDTKPNKGGNSENS